MKNRFLLGTGVALVLVAGWNASASAQTPSPVSQDAKNAITVYQDPNCGCCSAWGTHMRQAGFQVQTVLSADMAAVKQKLGVPAALQSCHTGVLVSGQIVEGHVPAHVVRKMQAQSRVRGIAAPGMPHNAPGMGALDGQLVTLDFSGKAFSRD